MKRTPQKAITAASVDAALRDKVQAVADEVRQNPAARAFDNNARG
jgi:hypothetical protein